MAEANRKVAATIPGAQHRILDGQTHNVTPAALHPVLTEFLA
jgi:hypothetical protein